MNIFIRTQCENTVTQKTRHQYFNSVMWSQILGLSLTKHILGINDHRCCVVQCWFQRVLVVPCSYQ